MKRTIVFMLGLLAVLLAGCNSPLLEKPAGEDGKTPALARFADPDALPEGAGTLSYRVGFPAGLTQAKLRAIPAGAKASSGVSIDLLEGLEPEALESAGELSLPAGYYRLALLLKLDDGGTIKTAAQAELIRVSPDQTLPFAASFSVEDFNDRDIFFDLAEMKAALEEKEPNTKDTPYEVSLMYVDISDWGEEGNPLGTLIDSLGGRYVDLDASYCFGDAIGDQSLGAFPPLAQRNYLVRLALPDTIDTIGSYFMYEYVNLKEVIMPVGLLSLGDYSFDRPVGQVGTGIETMDLSATLLTSLGSRVFLGCRKLQWIKFPASLTDLGYAVLAGCDSLVTIDQLAPLTNVGMEAFEECSELESIWIDANATLSLHTFMNCSSLSFVVAGSGTWSAGGANNEMLLTDGGNTLHLWPSAAGAVTIPSGIKKLGSDSFRGNFSVSSVGMGPTLQEIGSWAFYQSSITSLTLDGVLQTIGQSAFNDCRELTTVSVTAENLTTIPATAFARCTKLTTANLSGSSITTIEDGAFRDCWVLASVSLPNTLTEVAAEIRADFSPSPYNYGAFANTPALSSFTVAAGGLYLDDIGGQALLKVEDSGLVLVFWPTASGDIVIPDGITKISAVAFRLAERGSLGDPDIKGNTNITSVTFPSSLVELETSLGVGAFYQCYNLTTVDMSAATDLTEISAGAFYQCYNLTTVDMSYATDLTEISAGAFSYCRSLDTVSFPPNLESIGESAFMYCSAASFTTIELPGTVVSIGERAFFLCSNLTTLTVWAETPPTLGSSALYNDAWQHIYVPVNSVTAYKTAPGWIDYASIIGAIP